ncbi:MAG: MraY family glycosyltransferase [Spirochaetota bacterium]|nr:MraY family glycosyltransferase [Spirochaetota bacterium]
MGGLGIFIGFIIPFIIIALNNAPFQFNIIIYLIAIFIAFLTGFVDDLWNIRARYKLILQIISGLLVTQSGLLFDRLIFYNIISIEFGIFSNIITVLWIVMFMNAINLIDGMDGLASGIVFIANIFILLIAIFYNNHLIIQISIILGGAILGFYIFNFPPAKIFMGDGGAYFLGFLYATLPLMGIKKSSVATLFLIPFILLLIPIGDIARVIFIRWRDGNNIFLADKNHLHHRLQNLGFTNRGILFVIYGYTIILGLTSILLLYIEPKYSLILFLIISLLVLLTFYIFHHVENLIEKKDHNKE